MLSFGDYREMGGSVEDARLYARLSAKAGQIIRRATHGRLRGKDPPECVKNCVYELIELLAADRNAEDMLGGIAAGRDVASVSNDGVSVTFASDSSGNGSGGSSGSLQARCLRVVRQWLDGATGENGVHLLYGGIDA